MRMARKGRETQETSLVLPSPAINVESMSELRAPARQCKGVKPARKEPPFPTIGGNAGPTAA